MMIAKIRSIRIRRLTYLVVAAVELVAAIGCASVAINNGNLWWYLAALLLLVGSLQNLAELLVSFKRPRSPHR